MPPGVNHALAERPSNRPPERGTLLSAIFQNESDPIVGGYPPPGCELPPEGEYGADPYAAGMLPHPTISPFDHRFDQTINKDGMWSRYINDDPREYHFDIEWLHGRLRRPVSRPIGERIVRRASRVSDQSFSLQRGFVRFGRLADGESVFPVEFKSEGIRSEWGWEEADGSRFNINGWWLPDVSYNFDTFQLKTSTNATIIVGSRNAADLRFDRDFDLSYQTEAFSTGAEYQFTPWKRGKHHAIRPLVGFKYLNIQEEFGMFGRGRRNPDTFFENTTTTNLVGPEGGVAFEFGGENLLIMGESKFGVMYNHERITVGGQGFNAPRASPNFGFYEKRYASHVSPAWEASAVAQMRLFPLIPYIKRYQVFENAVVRVGYTYIAAYEIARPNDTVVWNTFPLVPTIEHERTKWHAEWLNFGLSWDY